MMKSLLADDYDIHWGMLNDTSLDLLLINHQFADLPNIVNLHHPSKYIIDVIKNENNIQGLRINDAFDISLLHGEAFKEWVSQSPEPEPIQNTTTVKSSAQSFEYTQIIHSKKIDPPKTELFGQENSIISRPLFTSKISAHIIEKFSNELWSKERQRHYVIYNAEQKIALIDTLTNEIWLDEHMALMNIEELILQPATLNTIVHFSYKHRSFDLRHGLWNFTWNNVDPYVPQYDHYYRLTHWPQPLNHDDRKDILRISAYLQRGAHLSYIQQQTGIPKAFINRFIFTCLMTKMIEKIPEHDIRTRHMASSQTMEKSGEIRSFFSRLRQKLGL